MLIGFSGWPPLATHFVAIICGYAIANANFASDPVRDLSAEVMWQLPRNTDAKGVTDGRGFLKSVSGRCRLVKDPIQIWKVGGTFRVGLTLDQAYSVFAYIHGKNRGSRRFQVVGNDKDVHEECDKRRNISIGRYQGIMFDRGGRSAGFRR